MTFRFGIDQLLSDSESISRLQSAKVGLVAHPASVTSGNMHSMDALMSAGCNIVRAFGPQHGMRGDKQDNMVESEEYLDPVHRLPVLSLYGEYRRPTDEMLAGLDILIFDLQDVGCRIYTYMTTLYYLIDACEQAGKEVWVLDRPNPAGRPVDGLYLEPGEESFVGCAPLPMRHGLTTGELARFFAARIGREPGRAARLNVIPMAGYDPSKAPGYGWPMAARPWVNPSPNAGSINMARCFPGTVLLEGTTLSEGRGTTTPLEVIGAPGLPIEAMLAKLHDHAGDWMDGVWLRPCFFTPTFHKHASELCQGLQIHTDFPAYRHSTFKPYMLMAGLLKALRIIEPGYDIWRYHEYEYEPDRTPIDVINGGPALRAWVDDQGGAFKDMAAQLREAEQTWLGERAPYIIYA